MVEWVAVYLLSVSIYILVVLVVELINASKGSYFWTDLKWLLPPITLIVFVIVALMEAITG